MKSKRIVLPGGSGFLGRILGQHLRRAGHEVVILSRNPRPRMDGIREVGWDGETLGSWAKELDGAHAVVNLAGRSVDCRYHACNRRLIKDSRINSTKVLGEAIAHCKSPPHVWFNSSTATIYRHSVERAMDEATGEIGASPEAAPPTRLRSAVSLRFSTQWPGSRPSSGSDSAPKRSRWTSARCSP